MKPELDVLLRRCVSTECKLKCRFGLSKQSVFVDTMAPFRFDVSFNFPSPPLRSLSKYPKPWTHAASTKSSRLWHTNSANETLGQSFVRKRFQFVIETRLECQVDLDTCHLDAITLA